MIGGINSAILRLAVAVAGSVADGVHLAVASAPLQLTPAPDHHQDDKIQHPITNQQQSAYNTKQPSGIRKKNPGKQICNSSPTTTQRRKQRRDPEFRPDKQVDERSYCHQKITAKSRKTIQHRSNRSPRSAYIATPRPEPAHDGQTPK